MTHLERAASIIIKLPEERDRQYLADIVSRSFRLSEDRRLDFTRKCGVDADPLDPYGGQKSA